MAVEVTRDIHSPQVNLTQLRRNYAQIGEVLPMPNLIQVQLESFRWFKEEGLKELFEEISPISDFAGKNLDLFLLDYDFSEPKYDVDECRTRELTYAAPMRVKARLVSKETGEIKEQLIFMGDFPLMTDIGTFVINGAERVVVSQLVRSPGVYLTLQEDATSGRRLCFAKLIPNRGAWLEFETSNKDILSVKVDRKRKIPITTFLRAIGIADSEDIIELFKDVDTGEHQYILETLSRDSSTDTESALIEFYRRLRPGDPPTVDNARNLLNSLLFNRRRYDLGRVGRYKLNRRLGRDPSIEERILTKEDLIRIVSTMIKLNNGKDRPRRYRSPRK